MDSSNLEVVLGSQVCDGGEGEGRTVTVSNERGREGIEGGEREDDGFSRLAPTLFLRPLHTRIYGTMETASANAGPLWAVKSASPAVHFVAHGASGRVLLPADTVFVVLGSHLAFRVGGKCPTKSPLVPPLLNKTLQLPPHLLTALEPLYTSRTTRLLITSS